MTIKDFYWQAVGVLLVWVILSVLTVGVTAIFGVVFFPITGSFVEQGKILFSSFFDL